MTRRFALIVMACASFACASGPWTELDSLDQLKQTFESDSGEVRLVLLLSPT